MRKFQGGRPSLMTLFSGWAQFIDQVLFWATKPKPELISEAVSRIEKRSGRRAQGPITEVAYGILLEAKTTGAKPSLHR